jgi:hypothetical protein
VTDRARIALRCDSVDVRPIGAGGYLASGCGRTQSYTCVRDGWRSVCVPDESPRDATGTGSVAAPATLASLPAEDVRIARAATASCDSSGDGFITLDLSAAGAVVRVETPNWSAEAATCVVMGLRSAHFSSRPAEQRGSVDMRRAAAPKS